MSWYAGPYLIFDDLISVFIFALVTLTAIFFHRHKTSRVCEKLLLKLESRRKHVTEAWVDISLWKFGILRSS